VGVKAYAKNRLFLGDVFFKGFSFHA
jgi:hypothetical protein